MLDAYWILSSEGEDIPLCDFTLTEANWRERSGERLTRLLAGSKAKESWRKAAHTSTHSKSTHQDQLQPGRLEEHRGVGEKLPHAATRKCDLLSHALTNLPTTPGSH